MFLLKAEKKEILTFICSNKKKNLQNLTLPHFMTSLKTKCGRF